MSSPDNVTIHKLPTGVPGLDEILGGGLPEYSFNIIAGSPGCGKSTLTHQIVFANATPERPALYFTVLGEPAIKMLRYQQQFTFFDKEKLDSAVRFINLSKVVLEGDLNAVLSEIVREVEAVNPAIVVVDSFRTVLRKAQPLGVADIDLQDFIQRLALHLTSWQATTFLIGEYVEAEVRDNPVFTVADGLIWLSQQIERNSIIRKMHIMKLRGQASIPGLHTFRITDSGLQTFPRPFGLLGSSTPRPLEGRLSTGIPELNDMFGGGIPIGDSLLIAGPSGVGKSTIASQFINEGLLKGEPGIVAVFEERPEDYIARAATLGMDFAGAIRDGLLKVLHLGPLDLSVDETVREIIDAVRATGAKRLCVDSLAGFELALAPSFRDDFRESFYRMVIALTRLGVTTITTAEVDENFTRIPFSSFSISFLADDILRLRYVEMEGEVRRLLVVVKMRRGEHSKHIREFEITSHGVVIGERISGYRGLVTGVPEPFAPAVALPSPTRAPRL